ncbi:MAG: cyclic nucleotide-binding domain-containing protein, partial [Solirubrobacteraceae bacterium]
TVVREITARAADLDVLVLDVRRVDDVADVARRMLFGLRDELRAQGIEASLVDPDDLLPDDPDAAPGQWPPRFAARDAALEWCEDRLLALHGTSACRLEHVAPGAHPLVRRAGDAAGRLVERLERRTFADGETVARRGDPAIGLGLVVRGRVAVTVAGLDGTVRPITTLAPGTSFGELYLVDGGVHATDLQASDDLELAVLTPEAFAALRAEDPELHVAVLETMVSGAHQTVARTAAALAEGGATSAAGAPVV